jgi:hypothetical protein
VIVVTFAIPNFPALRHLAVVVDVKVKADAVLAGVCHVIRRTRIDELDLGVTVISENVNDVMGAVGVRGRDGC